MGSLFLLVFCAAALLPLLPSSDADACTDAVETCANETAQQPMGTVDDKCRYLFMFKTCLEGAASCNDMPAQVSAMKTNMSNPTCIGDGCSSPSGCQGANQNCTAGNCTCMAAYKSDKGVCVGKVLGDPCTAGKDDTCSTNQTCSGDPPKCKCKMAFKETDNKTCTAKTVDDPCTEGQNASCGENLQCLGTNPNAKCACLTGFRPNDAKVCVAKTVDDPCTEGQNASCGENLQCLGTNPNATCACLTGFRPNDAKVCVAKKLNDSCEASVQADCGQNMTCTEGKCACKSGDGDNGKGMCAQSCAPSFKGDVGSCMPKTVGDNCTTGQNDTCSTGTYCKGGMCACSEGLKDDGTRKCAAQCAATFGDDGRGQCSRTCAKGMKGNVGHCTEVQVNDNCTAGDDSTCGTHQSCNGTTGNATCVCQEGYIIATSRLCEGKQKGSSGRLVLSLSLHLIPVVLMLIICKLI